MSVETDNKINLIKAFLQFESKSHLSTTWEELDGSFRFDDKFALEKTSVDILEDCKTISDVYAAYREMEFFPDPEGGKSDEDVYVLKEVEDNTVLAMLNSKRAEVSKLYAALAERENGLPHKLDIVDDWITALKSGKKIVNPLSPRDGLKSVYEKYKQSDTSDSYYQGMARGIRDAVEIIAEEHPDVKDWLEEGDPNA